MIFKNCTFFNENFEKEFGDIEVENGIIKQIGIIDGDGKDMAGTISRFCGCTYSRMCRR